MGAELIAAVGVADDSAPLIAALGAGAENLTGPEGDRAFGDLGSAVRAAAGRARIGAVERVVDGARAGDGESVGCAGFEDGRFGEQIGRAHV